MKLFVYLHFWWHTLVFSIAYPLQHNPFSSDFKLFFYHKCRCSSKLFTLFFSVCSTLTQFWCENECKICERVYVCKRNIVVNELFILINFLTMILCAFKTCFHGPISYIISSERNTPILVVMEVVNPLRLSMW